MSNHQNVRNVLAQVDGIDRAEGMVSYWRYHNTLRRFAEFYDAPFNSTVAVFCALSPNNDYMGNLRSMVTLLRGRQEGVQDVTKLTVSTYNACRDRAWEFLHGTDFLAYTKGPKTRNFYLNILNPADPKPVTIDGHMVSIWLGKRMRMVEVARMKWNYEKIARGFRTVAHQEGILANQLQAMLWFTWKRIHQVVYSPQLSLLSSGDQWGLDLDPRRVAPFPAKVKSYDHQVPVAEPEGLLLGLQFGDGERHDSLPEPEVVGVRPGSRRHLPR